MDAMIADFREKGSAVSPEIMVELRSAKALISVLLADPECADVKQKIEECLFNVESYAMAKGEVMMGARYVGIWSHKLDQASKKATSEEDTLSFPGEKPLPLSPLRGPNWIRINPIPAIQIDTLRKLADTLYLSCIPQGNGGLIVQGETDQLKEFIRNVASMSVKQNDIKPRCRLNT